MPRPPIEVDVELISDLAFLGLSTNQIARLVGCDDSTLQHSSRYKDLISRRRREREKVVIDSWLRDPAAAHENQDARVEKILGVLEVARIEVGGASRRPRVHKPARTMV